MYVQFIFLFCVCVANSHKDCSSVIVAVTNAWNGSSLFVTVTPAQEPVIKALALIPGAPVPDPVWSVDYDATSQSIFGLFEGETRFIAQIFVSDLTNVKVVTYKIDPSNEKLFSLVADQRGNLFAVAEHDYNLNPVLGVVELTPGSARFVPILTLPGIYRFQGYGVYKSFGNDKLMFTNSIINNEPLYVLTVVDLISRETTTVNIGNMRITAITEVQNNIIFSFYNGTNVMTLATFTDPAAGTYSILAPTNFTTSSNLVWDSCNQEFWCVYNEVHLLSVDMKGVVTQDFVWQTNYFPPAPMFVMSTQ